jgi:hypothetical protein
MKPVDTLYPHEWLWAHAKKHNQTALIISVGGMTALALCTTVIYIADSLSESTGITSYDLQPVVGYQPGCFSYSFPVLLFLFGILCILIGSQIKVKKE